MMTNINSIIIDIDQILSVLSFLILMKTMMITMMSTTKTRARRANSTLEITVVVMY